MEGMSEWMGWLQVVLFAALAVSEVLPQTDMFKANSLVQLISGALRAIKDAVFPQK